MQGYFWAETPENELFVVMVVDGKGYIPGVGGAIDLSTVALLDPVPWPAVKQKPFEVPQARASLRLVPTHS